MTVHLRREKKNMFSSKTSSVLNPTHPYPFPIPFLLLLSHFSHCAMCQIFKRPFCLVSGTPEISLIPPNKNIFLIVCYLQWCNNTLKIMETMNNEVTVTRNEGTSLQFCASCKISLERLKFPVLLSSVL